MKVYSKARTSWVSIDHLDQYPPLLNFNSTISFKPESKDDAEFLEVFLNALKLKKLEKIE